jgi:hypothetical protein
VVKAAPLAALPAVAPELDRRREENNYRERWTTRYLCCLLHLFWYLVGSDQVSSAELVLSGFDSDWVNKTVTMWDLRVESESVIWDFATDVGYCNNTDTLNILSWLHSFFLSRVSHKGDFYLERFLMRQHCTKQLILISYSYYIVCCVIWSEIMLFG